MSSQPIKKVLRIKRKKAGAKAPVEETQVSSAQRLTQTAINFVMHSPQYPNIIAMVRMGTKTPDVVDYFIERGDFQVNRKTAMLYLSTFRRVMPDLCKPVSLENGDNPNNLRDYDHLFDGNALAFSEEVELNKLIQLQKSRIAIDFANERSVSKLFTNTQKEIGTLGDLIEKLAKIRGTIKPASMTNNFMAIGDEDVRDGIANLRQDENNRAALTTAVGNVLSKIKQGI